MRPSNVASPAGRRRARLRVAAAVLFIGAGANHFVHPSFYRAIVPPGFPSPAGLVAISGACEIAGGVGLLVPQLRRWAGWGLIALLVAVFPANVFMAVSAKQFELPPWMLWARLPLQGVLIAWVWHVALARGPLPANGPEDQSQAGAS